MLTIIVDPLNEFNELTYGALINDGGGLLSTWIVGKKSRILTLKEALFLNYGVPYQLSDDCNLNGYWFQSNDDDGEPEKPLAPYVVFIQGNESVSIYPYGIVAITSGNDKPTFYRMD